jgi:hypothetical protein
VQLDCNTRLWFVESMAVQDFSRQIRVFQRVSRV